MTAKYPSQLYTERETENLPGITYDPANKRDFFSDDFQNHAAEIIAIEKTLGENLSNIPVPPVKATGAEINTGTNDAKFATPKAIADSDIAFLSDIPSVPVKATGAEITTGTNDTKFVTPKAMADAGVNLPSGGSGGGGMTLLKAANGSYAGAGMSNVSTIAISGLTALDTIKVFINIDGAVANTLTQNIILEHTTDILDLLYLDLNSAFVSNDNIMGECTLRQGQSANTILDAIWIAYKNATTSESRTARNTTTTAWTGSWTLGLQLPGMASGSIKWSWAVYKIAGQ